MFEWKIKNLERYLSDGYVFSVHFEVSLREDEHYINIPNLVKLKKPENMIPYEELTEEIVLNWIKSELGEERILDIEKYLQDALSKMKQKTGNGIPWGVLEEPTILTPKEPIILIQDEIIDNSLTNEQDSIEESIPEYSTNTEQIDIPSPEVVSNADTTNNQEEQQI